MKKLWMLFFICFAVMLVGCNKNEPPKQAFEEYINLWNDKKFANMYEHLSEHAKRRSLKRISPRNMKKSMKVLEFRI